MSQSIGQVLDELQSGKITKQQAVTKLQRQRNKWAAQEANKAREKYDELIMAVGNKYEGETRHQAALRYIKAAEQTNDNQTAAQDLTADKEQNKTNDGGN